MKLLILLSLLALAVGSNEVSKRQLGVGDWGMGAYNDISFTPLPSGDWQIKFKADDGAGLGSVKIEMYPAATVAQCVHGWPQDTIVTGPPGNPVGSGLVYGTGPGSAVTGITPVVGKCLVGTVPGPFTCDMTIDVSALHINYKTMSSGDTTVKACARVSLWDWNNNPYPVDTGDYKWNIWNFREIWFSATYDTQMEFEAATFETKAYDPEENTDKNLYEYAIDTAMCGYETPGGGSVDPKVFNQGEIVCIEICPGTANPSASPPILSPDAVLSFAQSYLDVRDDPDLAGAPLDPTEVWVKAYFPVYVDSGSQLGTKATVSWYRADTPSGTPNPAGDCLRVEFLLRESFFKSDDNPGLGTVPIQVKATGKVNLEGRRRLAPGRMLQQEEEEFEVGFTMVPSPDSGSYTIHLVGATMTAAAGAALLI
jgi:hypothetical protein